MFKYCIIFICSILLSMSGGVFADYPTIQDFDIHLESTTNSNNIRVTLVNRTGTILRIYDTNQTDMANKSYRPFYKLADSRNFVIPRPKHGTYEISFILEGEQAHLVEFQIKTDQRLESKSSYGGVYTHTFSPIYLASLKLKEVYCSAEGEIYSYSIFTKQKHCGVYDMSLTIVKEEPIDVE